MEARGNKWKSMGVGEGQGESTCKHFLIDISWWSEDIYGSKYKSVEAMRTFIEARGNRWKPRS